MFRHFFQLGFASSLRKNRSSLLSRFVCVIAVIASFGVAATAAAQQATTTTFTSNKATINDQETATLTVRVSCPTTCATTPFGSVVMLDLTTGETTTVVSLTADPFNAFRSVATIPWSGAFIALGGHVLRATYNGNATFASSVAPTITQTVLKTWGLSVNIVGSGSATVGGVAVASGGVVRVTDAVSQTIVATPAAGFHLASHAYDCSGSTTLSDGLANVATTITSAFTSNCTLTLTFTNTRTISVAALGGISGVFVGLTVPPSTSAVATVNVVEGGTVNIVGSPQNASADLLSIADPEGVTKFFMGNGEIYGGVGSMMITGVAKSRVVNLTFVATTRVPVVFQVGVGAFGGGTAQVPINQNVRSQVEFASFTGFFPSVITGDCPTPSGLPWALSDIVNSKITTNIIVGGCFVRVDFSTVINATAGAGGQVSPASRTVMSPSNPTFTLTPDAGFSVGTMGGTCSGSLAGNTYTAFVRGVQCTVIANFNATVTATAGAGGGVSPASAAVPQGATQNFTVSPNAGFVVGTVSGCAGTFVPATSVYTTGPITGPCTVAATFLANINGACGSASGITGVAVAPNANLCATGTATPVAANANNFTWGCNGSNGGTSTSAAACAVPRTYVVTGIASTGGVIGCASPVTGGNTTICALAASPNFLIGTVTGCGGTYVPGSASFTTGPISAPCTVSATFVGTIPGSERSVLIDLYNSTNGAGWTTKTNWLGAVGTECSWVGVFCDPNGTHVNRIALRGNNLTGTLPPLGALSSLFSFDVSSNRLTRSIPPFAGLSLLNVFAAAGNQLTGSVPSFAGITTLKSFDVSRNRLTGSIPALVGQNILFSFDVHSNQLTGPIPSLTGLSMLEFFYVNDNLLTGAVPDVPSPNALQAGNSSLCPNPLTISVNAAWDAATGATPWSAACASAQFTITPSVIGNGSISPSVPVIVPSAPPTLVSFTITPALGRTALYGGTCPLASSTVSSFTVAPLSDCTVVVTFLAPAVLDVDGSSGPTKYDPATDGVMILRYLFGLRGDAITNGLMSATATLTALQTQDHLVSIRSQLDIDGNGRIEPLTDGMMILRYMMGLRMPLVTLGVLGTGATRTLGEIDAYLGSLMP